MSKKNQRHKNFDLKRKPEVINIHIFIFFNKKYAK